MRGRGLLAVAVALVVGTVSASGEEREGRGATYGALKLFAEAVSIVHDQYVDPIPCATLVGDGLRSMLGGLDPDDAYLDPARYRAFEAEGHDGRAGIGVELSARDGALTVVAPIDGMPAGRAGVEPGDRILKIDGLSTADMPLVDAIVRLRGTPGTPVALSVARTGWGEARTITVARGMPERASVRTEDLKGGVLYARIRELEPATAGELGAALERASTPDLAGVVLDLRGTPRGTARAAVAVVNLFLPAGRAVARVQSRVPGQAGELTTSGTARYPTLPVVALVDAGTAGASELLAGALQDGSRAILVGVRTFGDGSSPSIIPLRNGGALRLTTARYLTPQGHPIERRGITPDLIVIGRAAPTPDPRADAALRRALEVIKVARIEDSRLATAA